MYIDFNTWEWTGQEELTYVFPQSEIVKPIFGHGVDK
jgi:hypothetical protein